MALNVIVLFNLQAGKDKSDFEKWAVETDLATVRKLSSVDSFHTYRTTGVLGSDAAAPYQYVEMLTINDFDQFGKDISDEVMQKVAGEFQGFADNPTFMLANSIED